MKLYLLKKNARTAVQKITENGLKNGFFDYIEKFDHQFFLNLVHSESVYILFAVFLLKYHTLEKSSSSVWAKVFCANQIAEF